MEKQTYVTKEELDNFMKELEGIKSTIEILQDKEMMNDIKETEDALKSGEELEKVNF